MSLPALLEAARDAIRNKFSLNEYGCEVTPDGRPIPAAGRVFFAVHPSNWDNSANASLDERYSFQVTVTVRTGVPPLDRVGTNVILDKNGVLRLAAECRAFVSMNYDVMNAANNIIGAGASGFHEPQQFTGATWLGSKGPDWFFADGEDEFSGVAVELNFGRARLVQNIESQE